MANETPVELIYAGTFHRTMDAKNRVTIPSEWLSKEDDCRNETLYLLPSRDGQYLNAMPPGEFARKEDELRASVPKKEWRSVMREVFGSARRIEPDKQGRILVPDDFVRAASLSPNLTFIGVKNSFEIWNASPDAPKAVPSSGLSTESRQALEALGL